MKEIRVYVIDYDEVATSEETLSDDRFIEIADSGGAVYSLPEFAQAFNNEDVSPYNQYIRFIEAEK